MSLYFYGVIVLGMVLGALVLLLLFSLLSLAQKGDEGLDQLELERRKTFKYAPPRPECEQSENLRVPAASDLYHGGTS
jgi:hypothetical protein